MFPGCTWFEVKDGSGRAAWLYERHYSARKSLAARKRNRKAFSRVRNLILGPGEKMVLLTADGLALFGWRKFIDDSGQVGVSCAVFRNEGPIKSSVLILEAEQLAWARWPGERLYTHVDASQVRHKRDPGRCFRKAGWRECGLTKDGLLVFEKLPG